ncbi:MAG: hypothetical protein ACK5H1_08925 [Tenacibaculum sp.]
MKKQQKTYILIFALVLVWGLVGYKMYRGLKPTAKKNLDSISEKKISLKNYTKSEVYKIKANYRDPFLGKLLVQKINHPKPKAQKAAKAIVFPPVIYNGMVARENTKLYTLTVNGRQEVLKIGESLNGVKLIKANKEKATVRFKQTVKILKLQ